MNMVDIAVVLGLLFFAFRGYSRGLFHEIMSLLTFLAGCAAAFRWTPVLSDRLAGMLPGPGLLTDGLGFLILFTLTVMTIRVGLTLVERIWVSVGSSPANRLGGTLFGIFKGALVLGFVLILLRGGTPAAVREQLPERVAAPVKGISGRVANSMLGAPLADLTDEFFSAVMDPSDLRVRLFPSSGREAS